MLTLKSIFSYKLSSQGLIYHDYSCFSCLKQPFSPPKKTLYVPWTWRSPAVSSLVAWRESCSHDLETSLWSHISPDHPQSPGLGQKLLRTHSFFAVCAGTDSVVIGLEGTISSNYYFFFFFKEHFPLIFFFEGAVSIFIFFFEGAVSINFSAALNFIKLLSSWA